MTSNNLLKRLDVVSLEACLTKWVFSKFESLQVLKTQHLQGVAEDLLKLRREHWTIENKVHWVRDTTPGADASQARTGNLPHAMAALRNTALSVLCFHGYTKIAETTRFFASKPKLAVKLIQY